MLNSIAKKIKEAYPANTADAHCDGPCGVYDPASVRIAAEAAVSLREASVEAESAYSGVNLDTEAANLIQQQQAYQASARILSTARELFETLIQVV